MNKRLKPAQHLEAGRILKSLDLSFDFGFMLLTPYSTFETLRNNIDFLETFVGDGWSVASFCRMLPYAGTPIRAKLEAEGRLLGTPFEPDYRFLDPKLDIFYDWMLETFYQRNFTNTGLCHILRSLLFEAHLNLSEYRNLDSVYRAYIHHLTAVCNGIAFYTLRVAVGFLESTPIEVIESDKSFLQQLTRHEREEEQKLLHEVIDFYWSIRQERGISKPQSLELKTVGGFEKSWTLAET
jgi:hypothetical protein